MPQKLRVWLLAAAGMTLVATATYACNIPVFRYALERWRPDDSEFLVFHPGPLAEPDLKLMDQFDDHDDVDTVWSNFDIPDAILDKVAPK